jgi:predicted RNA polymerase sigma factor
VPRPGTDRRGDRLGADTVALLYRALAAEPALASYHHLPSVRGDLLARLGRYAEAAAEFRRAASLTRNMPERTVLL